MIESASFPISAMFIFPRLSFGQSWINGTFILFVVIFATSSFFYDFYFTTTTSISPSSTSSTFSPFSVFSCIAIGQEIVSVMNSAVLKRWLACIYSCLSHQICCQAERGQDQNCMEKLRHLWQYRQILQRVSVIILLKMGESRFLFVLLPSYFTRFRMLIGKNGKKNHYIE